MSKIAVAAAGVIYLGGVEANRCLSQSVVEWLSCTEYLAPQNVKLA